MESAAYLKASNTEAGDFFGDQTNNGATDSGAAYIFTGLGTPIVFPALKAIRSGETLIITWPASVSGAVLESTTSFPAAAWTPVSIPPVIIGDQQAVTVNIEGRARFYRLRKP